MRPYCLHIGGYYHMSGGIRALHVLRDELEARGSQAVMSYRERPADCIAIYPEVTPDNPLGSDRIVRWLLNRADLPDDGLTYAWETGMGDWPLLTVDIIEPHLWQPHDQPRSGVAYWVGKGTPDPALIPEGAEHIGRHNYPTRPQLAERIRSLDYLVSFDPFTAVNLEAVLSGTPVLIHAGANQWTRDQVAAHGWTPYGIAWTLDELDQARTKVHLAHDHYETLRATFQQRIDAFYQATHTL